MDEFFKVIDDARSEYIKDYLPYIEETKKKIEEKEIARQQEQLERLRLDRSEGDEVQIQPKATLKSEDSHKPRGIEISLGGDEGDSDSDDMVIEDENKGVS